MCDSWTQWENTEEFGKEKFLKKVFSFRYPNNILYNFYDLRWHKVSLYWDNVFLNGYVILIPVAKRNALSWA